MINKERAHKFLDACLLMEDETSVILDMVQFASDIDCKDCPVLPDCKRNYRSCDMFIKRYLTQED